MYIDVPTYEDFSVINGLAVYSLSALVFLLHAFHELQRFKLVVERCLLFSVPMVGFC